MRKKYKCGCRRKLSLGDSDAVRLEYYVTENGSNFFIPSSLFLAFCGSPGSLFWPRINRSSAA